MRISRLAIIVSLFIVVLTGCVTKGIDQSSGHEFSMASKRVVGFHDSMFEGDFGYDKKALFEKVKQITHNSASRRAVYSFDMEGRLTNLWYQFNGLDIYTSEDHIYQGDRLISLVRIDSLGSKEVDSLIYDINGNLIEVQTSGLLKKTWKYHYEAAGKGRTIVTRVGSDDPRDWRWEIDSTTGQIRSIRHPGWHTLFDCEDNWRKGTRSCIKSNIVGNPKAKVQKSLVVDLANGLPLQNISRLGEAGSTQTDYTHIFDSTGNWIRREAVSSLINSDGTRTPIETRVEVRKIIYY